MGARGPAKTPVELQVRRGNPGKRSLPTPLATVRNLDNADEFPEFASGSEMLQWVLEHGGTDWISATDVTAYTAAALWDDWLLARETWRAGGSLKDYIAITQELHRCLGKLGLTPTDRSSLGLAHVKAKSKLEEMRERRRGPRDS